jgi:beta-glucosidase
LSYATFESDAFSATIEDGAVVVRGAVRNTGDRPGIDVVQVFGGHVSWKASHRRARRLLGFSRLEIPPGGRAEVAITVPMSRLAERDGVRRQWAVRGGTYLIDIGRHSADPLAQHINVEVPYGAPTP